MGNAQNLHRFTVINLLSSQGSGIPQQGACDTGGTEDKNGTALEWLDEDGLLQSCRYRVVAG